MANKLLLTILRNKWHLHALAFPIALVVTLMIKYANLFYLNELSDVSILISITFTGSMTALAIEVIEYRIMQGYQSKAQFIANTLDWAVSTICAYAGTLLAILIA